MSEVVTDSHPLIIALLEAMGIDRPLVRRVKIVINAGKPVVVYVDKYVSNDPLSGSVEFNKFVLLDAKDSLVAVFFPPPLL